MHARIRTAFAAASLAAAMGLAAVGQSHASAAVIGFPPPGSRAFITVYEIDAPLQVCFEVQCDIVSSATTPLTYGPNSFSNTSGFINASGEVESGTMKGALSADVASELDLAFGDTFTVHGGTGSFPVTFTMTAAGEAQSLMLSSALSILLDEGLLLKIGTFDINPAATDFPTVDPSAQHQQFIAFQSSTDPFTVPISNTVSFTEMVTPGQVFDLGFEASAVMVEGGLDFSHTITLTADVLKGVFLTSALGSKFGAVPEPETWATLLAGLAFVGLGTRARRTAIAPRARPAA
jgi:hypothetical protein